MKTIASIVAVLAVGVTASFAAPNATLKVGGKKFGHNIKFTATSVGTISKSTIYKYKLDGTVTGTGGLAKLAPAGAKKTIAEFIDSIDPGSSSELSGIFEQGTAAWDKDFLTRKISGTRTVSGVGKVTVKATITGGVDAGGKIYLTVDKVKVLANGTPVPGFIKFDKGALLTVDTASIIGLNATGQGIDEDAETVDVVVIRTGNLKGTATAQYATAPGTADAGDYTPTSGTITFANNEKQKTISIPIIGNAANDGSRQFTISLSSPGAGVALGTKLTNTITIFDND